MPKAPGCRNLCHGPGASGKRSGFQALRGCRLRALATRTLARLDIRIGCRLKSLATALERVKASALDAERLFVALDLRLKRSDCLVKLGDGSGHVNRSD
jgi:hypothetical protein